MSAMLMDRGIAAALQSGRVLIVPSAQRAAALRWNWARVQLAQGSAVWETPQILTWDAWLEARWESARQSGRVGPGTRRLNRSQQLQLWKRVLNSLDGRFGDAAELLPHATALMDSANRASQWLLPLAQRAVTDEERLLAVALAEVREWCRRNDCVILPLCTPAQLADLVAGPAPLIAGQRGLTALQQALAAQCWPAEDLLHRAEPAPVADVRLRVARSLEDELRACARWCEQHLAADAGRRLLVVSVAASSPDAQAVLLARALCEGTGAVPDELFSSGMLAVEGGAPLAQQQLVGDALAALRLPGGDVEFADLSRVLGSAYLEWGEPAQQLALRDELAESGFAQWPATVLTGTLARLAPTLPVADALAQWLDQGRNVPRRAPRVEWARLFSQWLGAARFARGGSLDSRDAQRLARWNELLDEFAALDAIGEPLSEVAAVEELQRLAAQARHAARSGDAAITFTTERGAPLARHDGIWVVGLAEQRWPEPPRPDPYVPLSEQRRCDWEDAGARQRLEQARWCLEQWRASTPELVLSHPQLEGDVHHRPSALPGLPGPHHWDPVPEVAIFAEPFCTAPAVPLSSLAPLPADPEQPLRRGQDRLRLQQACAFRSQAETRLGAREIAQVGDGIPHDVRGVLLHGLLDGLWRELRDQRALAALDEAARVALFDRHWQAQLGKLAGKRPAFAPRLLARERVRSLRVVLRVLEMELQRPFFRVLDVERQLRLATSAGVITLRVDRLDEDEQGRRWLIDYKSGKAEVLKLAEGQAQPLQLALYEQALALQGEPVQGMALLSLAPSQAGYSGAAPEPDWPGRWQRIVDWDTQRDAWRRELAALLQEHVAGETGVRPQRDACRICHLDILCRRAEPAGEAGADAAEGADE